MTVMDSHRLAQLDLNLLVLLDALLEERSVTGAGRRLGLSQPAVSRGLAKLRELLADALLVRSGRAMLPTPRATAVAPAVRRLLHDALAILEPSPAFDPRRSTRTFTLAASDYAERVLLVPLFAKLRRDAPGITWVVRPAITAEIPRAETGDVDLGLVPRPDEAPGLTSRLLFTDPYVVVGRQDRLPTPLDLRAYAALEHVRVSPDGRGGSAIDAHLARDGLTRRVPVRVPSFASALAVAEETDLVVTVPRRWLEHAPLPASLTHRPLEGVPPLAVCLVRHERYAADEGIAWLAAQIVEAAERLTGSARGLPLPRT